MNLTSIGNPAGSLGWFETRKGRVVNRTGTTLAVGEVVGLDILPTASQQAETQAGSGVAGITGLTELSAIFQNAVLPPVADSTTVKQTIYGVVTDLLDGAGADNTDVEIAIQGLVTVLVGDDLDIGDGLTISGTAADKELVIFAAGSNFVRVGLMLSNTNGSVTSANGTALFDGLAMLTSVNTV